MIAGFGVQLLDDLLPEAGDGNPMSFVCDLNGPD
jgi:hypothetical protein